MAPGGARARTRGHRNTTLSGDTRVDWSEAFALVPSLQVGYVWHAGVHAAEVAEGLRRIGSEIVAQVIVRSSAAKLADNPDARERREEQGRATHGRQGDGLQARSHVGQTPRPGAL